MNYDSFSLDRMIEEIRKFPNRSKLYYVLKRELSKLGYWKERPRGNPKKGFQVMKERQP